MTRKCEMCGKPFDTDRRQKRFCGDTCRKRASRGQVIRMPDRPADTASSGALFAATLAELEELNMTDSSLGQAALMVARQIEVGNETGAATAALVRELRATMEAAAAKSARPQSPVDELRRKRLERMGSTGA